MKRPTLLLAAVLALAGIGAAEASRPVPRTVTGCVIQGTFTDGRYTYKVRTPGGQSLIDTDLTRYEGMRIRIQGSLLPGDVLIQRRIRILSTSCTLSIR